MHHQPTTQATLFHLLALPPRPSSLPPAPLRFDHPLDTPQHHRNQPSRILPPHSSTFQPPFFHPLSRASRLDLSSTTIATTTTTTSATLPSSLSSSSSMLLCSTTAPTNVVDVVVVVVVTISAFLYSPRRRHAESTKRGCCYVALGDQQVSSSSSTLSSSLRRRHSPASKDFSRILLLAVPLTRRAFSPIDFNHRAIDCLLKLDFPSD